MPFSSDIISHGYESRREVERAQLLVCLIQQLKESACCGCSLNMWGCLFVCSLLWVHGTLSFCFENQLYGCKMIPHLRQSSLCAGRSCPTSASKTFNCRPSSSKRIPTSSGLAWPRSTYESCVCRSKFSFRALGYSSTMLVEEFIDSEKRRTDCWREQWRDSTVAEHCYCRFVWPLLSIRSAQVAPKIALPQVRAMQDICLVLLLPALASSLLAACRQRWCCSTLN